MLAGDAAVKSHSLGFVGESSPCRESVEQEKDKAGDEQPNRSVENGGAREDRAHQHYGSQYPEEVCRADKNHSRCVHVFPLFVQPLICPYSTR